MLEEPEKPEKPSPVSWWSLFTLTTNEELLGLRQLEVWHSLCLHIPCLVLLSTNDSLPFFILVLRDFDRLTVRLVTNLFHVDRDQSWNSWQVFVCIHSVSSAKPRHPRHIIFGPGPLERRVLGHDEVNLAEFRECNRCWQQVNKHVAGFSLTMVYVL